MSESAFFIMKIGVTIIMFLMSTILYYLVKGIGFSDVKSKVCSMFFILGVIFIILVTLNMWSVFDGWLK